MCLRAHIREPGGLSCAARPQAGHFGALASVFPSAQWGCWAGGFQRAERSQQRPVHGKEPPHQLAAELSVCGWRRHRTVTQP